MKQIRFQFVASIFFAAVLVFSIALALSACAGNPDKASVAEIENKGSALGIDAPEWVKVYIAGGAAAVQRLPEFDDDYCVIGETSGANKTFVLEWADSFSAQQRIGAMLRNTIVSQYEAAVEANASSLGALGAEIEEGAYGRAIDNSVNAIVNVTYAGAQREADWWSLRRRYSGSDYSDEYAAWVLYSIPKKVLDRQVAFALASSVSADSGLYDITVACARKILLEGIDSLDASTTAEPEPAPPAQPVTFEINSAPLSYALANITPQEEYALGRAVTAALLNKDYKMRPTATEMTSYVNKICQAMAVNSPRPEPYAGYHAAVLDSDEINGFSTPAGHIFITRGLVLAAESEDALASVIAHEIAHIQMRHGLKSAISGDLARAILAGGGTDAEKAGQIAEQTGLPLATVAEIFGRQAGNMTAVLIANGYSQLQELNADFVALGLLAQAGYNPTAMNAMFAQIDKLEKGSSAGFHRTHPLAKDRIAAVNNSLAFFPVKDTSSYRQSRFRATAVPAKM